MQRTSEAPLANTLLPQGSLRLPGFGALAETPAAARLLHCTAEQVKAGKTVARSRFPSSGSLCELTPHISLSVLWTEADSLTRTRKFQLCLPSSCPAGECRVGSSGSHK